MSDRMTQARQSGLSLIELMIAVAIGTVLLLGLVQVFAASRTAYQLSEGLGRVQENARFATDFLQRDIRMAGHMGCVNDQSHLQTPDGFRRADTFPAVTSATTGVDFPVSIRGYEAENTAPGDRVPLPTAAANWSPNLPTALSSLGPAPGSDIIELRFLSGAGVPVTALTNDGSDTTITVGAGGWASLTSDGVANPDMFALADCANVDIFPSTSTAAATGTIVAGGTVIDRYTAGQVRLYRVDSLVYYVANGASGARSLWRARSTKAGTYTNTEELVEGIESLQFLYGLDNTADLTVAPPSGYVSNYATAANVTNSEPTWRGVGHVQVGFLTSSPQTAAAANPISDAERIVLGTKFAPPTTADGRFRDGYETTVALRNRLYGN